MLSKSPHPLATLTMIGAPSLPRVLLSSGVIELPVQAEDETDREPLPHASILIFDPLNQRTVTRMLRYLKSDQVIKQSIVVGCDTLYVGETPDGIGMPLEECTCRRVISFHRRFRGFRYHKTRPGQSRLREQLTISP